MRVVSRLVVLLLCLLAAAGRAPAQNFDLENGREPIASLDGFWRFHPGDDMAWASPSLDDAGWPLLRSDQPWSEQGYRGMSGFGWYRFSVTIPPGDQPTDLLLAPIVTSFQVFVEGRFAGGWGNMPPVHTPNTSFSFHRFPLTASGSPSTRTVHVAIRVWHSPMWSSYMGGGPWQPGGLVGAPRLMAAELRHHQTARNVVMIDQYSYSIAAGMVGFAILFLFLTRPVEREYLWFALLVLAQSGDCVLNISKEIWAVPVVPVYDLLDAAFQSLIFGANLCFIARILHVRMGRGGKIIFALLALSPLAAPLYWTRRVSVPASAALQLTLLLPAVLAVFYLLVRKAIRGNQDARLLLVPVSLASGYYGLDNLAVLLDQAGLVEQPRWMLMPLRLPPFTIHIQVLLNLVFLLAMLVFLIRRFVAARQKEERLAGEFEAAREVQQMLLPDRMDQSPFYRVESVYRPADEVGGDFFQQVADSQGGMLLVVGDVSGKGLPAALIVSVLVGAIRAEADHSTDPAVMLASLNERMVRRSKGGFVTCLAAHLRADGTLIIANAGHIAPYLNGEELETPGSLPLGIIPGVPYATITCRLQPGDRLTFVSDGVVEAQTRGGELFGFERARALSGQSAEAIAAAAQAFGQNDDVTVVTVEFAGAAVTA